MNCCNFVGFVHYKRKLDKDYNKEDILRFVLRIPRGKGKGYELIECEAFSKAARAMNDEIKVGDLIGIVAKCRTTTWDMPEGQVKKQRFQTSQFYLMGDYDGQ